MKLITICVPVKDLEELDLIVKRGYCANRSELIRVGIKYLLKYYFERGVIEGPRIPKLDRIGPG